MEIQPVHPDMLKSPEILDILNSFLRETAQSSMSLSLAISAVRSHINRSGGLLQRTAASLNAIKQPARCMGEIGPGVDADAMGKINCMIFASASCADQGIRATEETEEAFAGIARHVDELTRHVSVTAASVQIQTTLLFEFEFSGEAWTPPI